MWKLSPVLDFRTKTLKTREKVKVGVVALKGLCGVGMELGCPTVRQRVRVQLMVHIFFLISILCFEKDSKMRRRKS